MSRRTWVVFSFFLLAYLGGSTQNSRDSRIDKKHKAVNSYIVFANETFHLLWELHIKLEKFNREANEYQAGEKSTLHFNARNLVHDFAFDSRLKAVCTTKPADIGIRVDLKDLYEKTSIGNGYIPMPQRMQLNRYRDEMYFDLISVLSLTDSLNQYVRIGQYKVDKKISRGYKMLNEFAKIYGRIQTHKNNLELVCKQLAEPIPTALRSLQNIMTYSREILVAIRNDEKNKLPALNRKLESAVAEAERMKVNSKENLLGLELYYNQENSGYAHMVEYAEQIQIRAKEYVEKGFYAEEYKVYGKAYYYYNERMLAIFNHHKYGISAYYNRFIGFANRIFVIELEEVPLFKVITPEMNKALANAPIEVPTNFLEGAPSNNMVFLLDVSASMDRPEKLNLLKESISFLVDIMRPQDEISVIIYSGDARVILNPTSAMFKAEIKSAIRSMKPGGKTKALQGLKEAYKVAEKNFKPRGNNRIIMASDGAFEVNDALLRYVNKKATKSIQLSVLLFNKLENLQVAQELSELANRGGGTYSHVQPKNANMVLAKEANTLLRR